MIWSIHKKSGLYVEKKTAHFSIFSKGSCIRSYEIDEKCLPAVRKLIAAHYVLLVRRYVDYSMVTETQKFFLELPNITST